MRRRASNRVLFVGFSALLAGCSDDTPSPAPVDAGPMDSTLDAPVEDIVIDDVVVVDASCTTAAQCDDGDPCTDDACDGERASCVHTARTGCCTTADDCDDGLVCTGDVCNAAHACEHPATMDCCTTDADCDDRDACTNDACDEATNRCARARIVGCCTTAANCNDRNACTTDTCSALRVCEHAGVAGCCTTAADCNDDDACSADSCLATTRTCTYLRPRGCCTSAAECDDSNACTVDTCPLGSGGTGTCGHAAVAVAGDTCASVRVLAMPPSNSLMSASGSTACATNNFPEGPGKDLAFQFTLPGAVNWVLYADTVGTSFDAMLGLHSGACPGTLIATSDDRCGTAAQLVRVVPAGTYTLVVDAHSATAAGSFLVHLRAVPVPTGLTVWPLAAGTTTLTSATGALTGAVCYPFTGSSRAMTQPCATGSAAAPERIYALGLCPGMSVTAQTCAGATWDTVLAVRPMLTVPTTYSCSDDACGNASRVTWGSSVANVNFLMVDGSAVNQCGPYTLRLTGY